MEELRPKNGTLLLVEVAEDCLIFWGNMCACTHNCDGSDPVQNSLPETAYAEAVAAYTKSKGKNKIVVLGHCDCDTKKSEKIFAGVMAEAKIEYVWLYKGLGGGIHFARENHITFRRFSDVNNFEQVLKLLDAQGERISSISWRVREEGKFLERYPIVGNVESIESHDHRENFGVFCDLFAIPAGDLVSTTNVVALFNQEFTSGVLVTKSQYINFKHPNGFDDHHREIFFSVGKSKKLGGFTKNGQGSIRIQINEFTPEISLYCRPGRWQVNPHPVLNISDLNAHYIPMWQRLSLAGKKVTK